MKISPENLARVRALFALKRFPADVQSDVLSGSDIAQRFHIPVSPIARLNDQLIVDRTALFTAFQCAVDGLPIPSLLDHLGKPIDAAITVEGDVAIVTRENRREIFKHAPLLSSNRTRRVAALEGYKSKYTLTNAERERLEVLVNRDDYSNQDFIAAATLLSSTPESFAGVLRDKAKTGDLAVRDLLPQQLDHWSHLIAPPTSRSLLDFATGELASERRARIQHDPANALVTVSLTFASPALVPRELFADAPSDALLEGINRVVQFDDPFALSGTFDICVDRAAADPRFVAAGEKILDKLFGDMAHLNTACDMFGASFMIAVAYLAEHETLRRRPVYWRRLAAAAHAGLIVRALGVPKESADESLVGWATRVRGPTYYLSILTEFVDEPRWRPDWITPRFVIADVYGRTKVSAYRYSREELPPGWRQRLTNAESWIKANNCQLLAYYPALLEGARRERIPSLQELVTIADAYQRLIDQPALGTFLGLTPAVQTFGFPSEGIEAVTKVVQALRSEVRPDEQVLQAALTLAAGIATEDQDHHLADLVADVAVEMAGAHKENSVTETVFRIVECAAANRDRHQAATGIARRLENLAFIVAPFALNNLIVLMTVLQTLDERLAPELGRAIAIARLGRSRRAAV